ncbi:MAG TPA: ThuA domain-containing protein [Phycisphaerae bacterium]|nr:ThuA domain-containing protein [Phycisphaerae bacterium]HRY70401.1 ThuA domain-containing protein [Phycisphaerae bacterium]HSA28118.1 ThuA domain-containing protein [Phycisphaerae bacterium]
MPINVLILTGANNHDWQATTPVIKQIFEGNARFAVADVITDPAKCDSATFAKCDVVVSNWSAYPAMTGHQWGVAAEKAFVDFIKSGHGFVAIHAASATSQDWPELQQLLGLTWGLDKTAHGAYHTLKVTVEDHDHPITKGMPDFWITDELWHNMVCLSGQSIHTLCKAWSEPEFSGTGKFEPVLVPTQLGTGRGLNIVLGHDAAAMRNLAWQTLLLRGTEWAATGQVTLPIPEHWPDSSAEAVVTGVDPDAAIKAVLDSKFGQDRQALFVVEQLVNASTAHDHEAAIAARRQLAAELAAALEACRTPQAKSFLCKQLAMIGGPDEVKNLATLLGQEDTADMARFALERIPGEGASLALRSAMSKLSGKPAVGVINSVGNRAEPQAVKELIPLLSNSDPPIVEAAAAALGKIGSPEAAHALSAILPKVATPIRASVADACLRCADKLAAGNKDAAEKIYRLFDTETELEGPRLAARAGRVALKR